MSLISLVVNLGVVGVLLWLANIYLPMADKIKTTLNVVVVVGVVVWLFLAFGLFDRPGGARIP